MRRLERVEIDNRDSDQMYGYLEARVEVMKRRISDLEAENQNLRLALFQPNLGCGVTSALPLWRPETRRTF
jgi:hypothetical protein